jgi:hypothetical protein
MDAAVAALTNHYVMGDGGYGVSSKEIQRVVVARFACKAWSCFPTVMNRRPEVGRPQGETPEGTAEST